ncbi:MAG TPA: alkaline phosphatase family protein [Streptosporangiaceae bacterium]
MTAFASPAEASGKPAERPPAHTAGGHAIAVHATPLHGTANPAANDDRTTRSDQLPQVSWLVAPTAQTEHPDYFPAAGAEYIAQKLDAIASNPDVWAKTAFILCYDENDGMFDHVPPPVAPAGTPDEFVDGLNIGLGFRTLAVPRVARRCGAEPEC